MLWYQKEYASGELHKAFWDVAVPFSSEVFQKALTKIEKWATDSSALESMLRQLCSLVIITPDTNLIVERGEFTLKEGGDQDGIYWTCRRTDNGWLFKIGRSDGSDLAMPMGLCVVECGWQRLSYDHPLSGLLLPSGPSRHLGLYREGV